MQKKLFNHHKYKRRAGRWWRGQRLSSSVAGGNAKDFAWHTRKQNPFYRSNGSGWATKVKVCILALSVCGIFFLITYHAFFRIHDITVTGTQRISEQELRDAIQGIMQYKKFFVLPGNNYFLVHTEEIRDVLMQRFPIHEIVISKEFPNRLTILVQEKISTLIYDNGAEYVYIGLDGKVVEVLRKVGDDEWRTLPPTAALTASSTETEAGEVSSTTAMSMESKIHRPQASHIIKEMGDFPIIYHMQTDEAAPLQINDKVIEDEIVSGVIAWHEFLESSMHIPSAYIVVEGRRQEGSIETQEGWTLLVRLTEDLPRQQEAVRLLLQEQNNSDSFTIVDVRFPGRVYWR